MQTMVESELADIESGYFGRAVQLATDALAQATKAPAAAAGTFNFWKAVADALGRRVLLSVRW